MAANEKGNGIVAAGFGLLWRRQGILWKVFVVNCACGALGTVPAALVLRGALNHSLAAEPLSKGFNLGMFLELTRLPGVSLMRSASSSYLFAFVFFVFMLFVSGGILETYRQDRGLGAGEFFGASGAFFWRFVRLMLLSIIPFALVGTIYQRLHRLSDFLGDRTVADQVGIFSWWASIAVCLLLALAVRLWFDVAQVRAVAQNERGMWRNVWSAGRIIRDELGSLFWMYFRISLFAWVTLVVGLTIWAHLPPTATPVTFVLLELMLLAQLTTRFWQLASATVWYQRHAEMLAAESAGYTTPQAEEVLALAPSPEAKPFPDLDPELPPADA